MSASQFGSRFSISTFGESHGVALGVLIDGCPAGVPFDAALLQKEMDRRRPGQTNQVVSGRQEEDQAEVLSGVFENKTLGTPIAIIVRNKDARSQDYEGIKTQARAGHADDMWRNKFSHSDHRGGGRSSGRETVSRVMAGAVAQMMMKVASPQTRVVGYASQIASFELSAAEGL
jgi:chorismate synthase